MNKLWLIGVAAVGSLAAADLGACGSSSGTSSGTAGMATGASTTSSTTTDAATSTSSSAGTGGVPVDGTTTTSSTAASSTSGAGTGGGGTGGGATTTIAAARTGNVTTPITVDAVVTALAGVPNDYPTWYIEDPAGGPLSGVAVYCDPDLGCTAAAAPPVGTLVQITGSLSTYKGQLQLVPTKQTIKQMNATLPPVAMLTPADLAPTGSSMYRGVVVQVQLGGAKLTVDDVTPSALFDTQCNAGADGGLPGCATLCEPPAYAGFQANDGSGHEIYVEAPFFNTDHLQSSPECLTQAGVKPVTVGTTFSMIEGVLDLDPYGQVQYVAPQADKDYTTP
jgi:hypothetical protein